MKIVYNPKDGAPITAFIFEGKRIRPHFPDGYAYNTPTGPGKSNGLLQYTDSVAQEALERYGFLRELTLDEAKAIIDRPADPEFKCEQPDCDFATTHKVALIGHSKSHAKGSQSEIIKPLVDPLKIPIADGEEIIQPIAQGREIGDNIDSDIPNGPDKDGVDWYGDGAVVQNNSAVFGQVRENGKGHFVG